MAHDDHSAHHVNYLAVFVALCVFTALSVIFDLVSFSNHAITIVLVLGRCRRQSLVRDDVLHAS